MHVALLTRLLRDETSWTLVKSSELEQKRQAARVTLDKFKTSSKEAWPDVKPGIQAAMNDVETAYRRAAPQFK